jgi:hypothetical protein
MSSGIEHDFVSYKDLMGAGARFLVGLSTVGIAMVGFVEFHSASTIKLTADRLDDRIKLTADRLDERISTTSTRLEEKIDSLTRSVVDLTIAIEKEKK